VPASTSAMVAPPEFLRAAALVPQVDESVTVPLHRRDGAALYLVGRMRLAVRGGGVVERGDERFPMGATHSLELPERLGGGFLFHQADARGTRLWRARSWTGELEALGYVSRPAHEVVVGFDRIYLRSRQGSVLAIDPADGRLATLGPLPDASAYGAMAFVDGWRAVVDTDVAGPMATFDGGETWRKIEGLAPIRTILVGDGDPVIATEDGHVRLLASGVLERPDSPSPDDIADDEEVGLEPPPALGANALRVAVERGIPDSMETVLVAHQGKLARVAVPSGRIVALAESGPGGEGAACQGVRLGDGLGFVCGAAGRATTVHRFVAPFGVAELRRFEEPRFVSASGNGRLVVRGACGAESHPPRAEVSPVVERVPSDAPTASAPTASAPAREMPAPAAVGRRHYCILDGHGGETEVAVSGELGVERVTALADGRVAIVIPPRPGVEGMLNLIDGRRTQSLPLRFGEAPADAVKAARGGLWLDGMWLDREGSLGAWVEAGGRVIGVRLALDGAVTLGPVQDSAPQSMFSGPLALAFHGEVAHESTDGGRTWRRFTLPQLPDAVETRTRGCSPAGCSLPGWLRVGWFGDVVVDAVRAAPEVPSRTAPLEVPASLSMSCVDSAPKTRRGRAPLKGGKGGPAAVSARAAAKPQAPPAKPPAPPAKPPAPPAKPPIPSAKVAKVDSKPHRSGSGKRPVPARPSPPRIVLGKGRSTTGEAGPPLAGWLDFMGQSPPRLAAGEDGFGKASFSPFGTSMHAYVWGPRSGAWTRAGSWTFRFGDRFDPGSPLRETARGRAPFGDLDAALDGLGARPHAGYTQWYATRDPGGRALLATVCRSNAGRCELFSAVDSQPPVTLASMTGARRPRERGAVLLGARWYFLTDISGGYELWRADPTSTTMLSVIRRVGGTRTAALDPPALVRRDEDGAIGLLLQAATDELQPARKPAYLVYPIDPETGAIGTPLRIGLESLGTSPRRCTGEEEGFRAEVTLSTATAIDLVGAAAHLDGIEYRLRLDPERSCVEGIVARTSKGYEPRELTPFERPSGVAPLPLVVDEAATSERRVFDCYPR